MIGRLLRAPITALWPLCLVVVLSFPALRPLMEAGYPEGHDSLVHLFRLVEFHRLFSDGELYPRWFPDFALGYGYPLLNFYSPLTYFLSEAFYLAGFGYINAVKLTVASSIVVSGLGMYLYVHHVLRNRSAALLAAVAYVYLPYRLVDVYIRGAFAEAISLAFLPLLLLSFHVLASKGAVTHLFISALLLAGLFLTHPAVIFFVPILVAYVFVVAVLSSSPCKRIYLATAALLAGLAMSSFYWLPALGEQGFASPENFALLGITPSSQLIKWADMAQRHLLFNYREFPFKMGMAEAALAIAGLVVMALAFIRRRTTLLPLLVFPAFGILLLFLMSPLSALFWEKVPLTGSIQFPWRLLAFVGLCSSVCISWIATLRRLGAYAAAIACGVLIASSTLSLPVTNLDITDDDLSIGMIARYEYNSGIIGTTYMAEWLPAVAKAGFISPVSGPQKVPPPDGLPPLSRASLRRIGPLAYSLDVLATQPTSVRLHAFAFPGWQARVDGSASPAYPSSHLGLATVDVPEGEHTVDISFGDTPIRAVGLATSAVTVMLLAAASLAAARRTRKKLGYYLGVSAFVAVGLLVLAGLAPKAPPAMGQDLRWSGQRPMQADFEGRIRMLGFELRPPAASRSDAAEIVLYWQSLAPIQGDFSASLEWIEEGEVAASAGIGWPVFATSPARTWSSNEVVRDLRPLQLPSRPLARATLRLTALLDGRSLGSVDLGTMESVPARRWLERGVEQSVIASYAGKVGLAGYSVRSRGQPRGASDKANPGLLAVVRPGGTVSVDLDWKALSQMDEDYTVFVHLYTRKQTMLSQHDTQPQSGFRPTSLWEKDRVIQDSHLLSIPSSAPPGIYGLVAGFYQLRSMARLNLLGTQESIKLLGNIKVSPGQFKLAPSHPLGATFGGSFTLKGYDLGRDSASPDPKGKVKIALGLYWRADGEADRDYKVFVHLADDDGRIVAQQDGEPVDGNYPTSYWSKGEEMIDRHEVYLSGEELATVQQVIVGLYDPATGRRLTTSAGMDSISIPVETLLWP